MIFKEVEPEEIFRHLIWSVIFIGSAAYYIHDHILPNVEAYKEQHRFTRVTQEVLEDAREINRQTHANINSFSSSNYDTINAFSGTISEVNMKKYIQNGFKKIDIKKSREEIIKDKQLKKTHYYINGEVATNNVFLVLEIVPRLHNKNISAILDLPLTLKKNKRGNIDFSLGVSTTMSIYSSAKA